VITPARGFRGVLSSGSVLALLPHSSNPGPVKHHLDAAADASGGVGTRSPKRGGLRAGPNGLLEHLHDQPSGRRPGASRNGLGPGPEGRCPSIGVSHRAVRAAAPASLPAAVATIEPRYLRATIRTGAPCAPGLGRACDHPRTDDMWSVNERSSRRAHRAVPRRSRRPTSARRPRGASRSRRRAPSTLQG
jgi:hypothetical protein